MAKFTEQAIKASLMKLLSERALNKISVRDIVEDCGINRNSFYYHFQDIPTLLESIITEMTDNLISEYPSVTSLDECFQVAFKFALDNRKAMMHIYQSVNRDLFECHAMKMCEYAVRTYITTAFAGKAVSENDKAVIIRFLKCTLFGMCIDWVGSGMKDDAIEEVQRMLELCKDIPDEIIARSNGSIIE